MSPPKSRRIFAASRAKSAVGETLTAPKVDSVNTFESPNTVVPKPVAARGSGQ